MRLWCELGVKGLNLIQVYYALKQNWITHVLSQLEMWHWSENDLSSSPTAFKILYQFSHWRGLLTRLQNVKLYYTPFRRTAQTGETPDGHRR